MTESVLINVLCLPLSHYENDIGKEGSVGKALVTQARCPAGHIKLDVYGSHVYDSRARLREDQRQRQENHQKLAGQLAFHGSGQQETCLKPRYKAKVLCPPQSQTLADPHLYSAHPSYTRTQAHACLPTHSVPSSFTVFENNHFQQTLCIIHR